MPCLEVNREFILGVRERKWKATLTHRFVELLRTKTIGTVQQKGKLVRLYTQNIDGLEDQCEGIGHENRIAVHGSMDRFQDRHPDFAAHAPSLWRNPRASADLQAKNRPRIVSDLHRTLWKRFVV